MNQNARWLTIKYRPGFAADLTSWSAEIDREGGIRQTVRVLRGFDDHTEVRESRLTIDQITEIERLLAATDFAVIESNRVCIDDAEQNYVAVETTPSRVFCAPLFSLLSLRHLYRPTSSDVDYSAVENAIRLWEAIDRVMPYKRAQ